VVVEMRAVRMMRMMMRRRRRQVKVKTKELVEKYKREEGGE
jgi:hypothetical protein